MAVNYIQPNTPLNASLWNDVYSELDRKVNTVTNGKSIAFASLDLSLYNVPRTYRFFDGAVGVIGTTFQKNFNNLFRLPYDGTGWYSFLSSSYSALSYDNVPYTNFNNLELRYNFTGGSGCTAESMMGGYLTRLAIPRVNGPYYRVTGLDVTSSGSGYIGGASVTFLQDTNAGPYKQAFGHLLTGISGAVSAVHFSFSNVGAQQGTYFGAPPTGIQVAGPGSGLAFNILTQSISVDNVKLSPDSFSHKENEPFSKLEQIDLYFEGNPSFTFPKEYDRFKFFRIFNFNNYPLVFTFEAGGTGLDTSAGDGLTLTIPTHSSKCVRRDFGKYTTGFNHFQKFLPGDGRFDGEHTNEAFRTDAGLVAGGFNGAGGKPFNNIYDPIDFGVAYINALHNRWVIDKTKYWNGESLYYGANKPYKPKTDSTIIGDFVYHTGDYLLMKKYSTECSGHTFEFEKFTYDGFKPSGQMFNLPIKSDLIPGGYSLTYTGQKTGFYFYGNNDCKLEKKICVEFHSLNDCTIYDFDCAPLVTTPVGIINALNKKFKNNNPDALIQFSWSGIVHHSVGQSHFEQYDNSLKTQSPAVDPTKNLNIWIHRCFSEEFIPRTCGSWTTTPSGHGSSLDGIALHLDDAIAEAMDNPEVGPLTKLIGTYLGLSGTWGELGPGFTSGQISTMNATLDSSRKSLTEQSLTKVALIPLSTNILNETSYRSHTNPSIDKFQFFSVITGKALSLSDDIYRPGIYEAREFSKTPRTVSFHISGLFSHGGLYGGPPYISYPIPGLCPQSIPIPTGHLFSGGTFTFAVSTNKPQNMFPSDCGGKDTPPIEGYFGCNNHADLSYYIPVLDLTNHYFHHSGEIYSSSPWNIPPEISNSPGISNLYSLVFFPETASTGHLIDFLVTQQGDIKNYPTELKNSIVSNVTGSRLDVAAISFDFNGAVTTNLNWKSSYDLSSNGAPIFNFFKSQRFILDQNTITKNKNAIFYLGDWSIQNSARASERIFTEGIPHNPNKESHINSPYSGCEPQPKPIGTGVFVTTIPDIKVERNTEAKFADYFQMYPEMAAAIASNSGCQTGLNYNGTGYSTIMHLYF